MSNGTTHLYRPLEGRWLAGVAAGLGLHFGVPVWIIRIAFALLCFAGGLGVLLYIAGWLLIPCEGETDAIVQGWLGTGQARRWVGVLLVGLAVIILASQTGLIRGDLAFAVVLIGLGVMLYRGDLGRGDARQDDVQHRAEAAGSTSTQHTSSGAGSSPPTETPPSSATPTAPAPRETSYLGRVTVGFAVLALGVLGLLDSVVPGFHPEFRHYVGLLVAVVGVGLVVGAWFGRSGGLIVLGLVLIPFLVLSPLAELIERRSSFDFEFTSTERSIHRVNSVWEIRDEYDVGVGSLLIDLRDVEFAGQIVETEIDLGIGEVRVLLPHDVAAEVEGDVGIGALQVGDHEQGGLGVAGVFHLEGSEGMLAVDADVGVGQIVVSSSPGDDRSSQRSRDGAAPGDVYRIEDGEDLLNDYNLTSGSLWLDLGELELENDRRVRVNVGRGDVWVTLPSRLDLQITGEVGRGQLILLDEIRTGSNLHAEHRARRIGGPQLTLYVGVGEGSLIVEEER